MWVSCVSSQVLHRLDQWQRLNLPHAHTCVRCLAPDGRFDRVELSNAPQRFSRDGRGGRLMHFIKLPPCMGPARRELYIAASGEPLEAGIAVDLNDAFELD